MWKDDDIYEIEALDLIRGGAFNVTKPIAELIMSFDPYGVEVYPAKLTCSGDGVLTERYIIAVDNLVDVVDYDKGIKVTDVTTRFYLSNEKIKELPDSKRHVFKPVGMTKTFFSIELFEALNVYLVSNYAEQYAIYRVMIATGQLLSALRFEMPKEWLEKVEY
ncbi:hypothetical protein NOL29_25880 [Vibrio parahaemolyticus]|nr:hypothetical protein [Vibrio parahaemolyticus]